MSSRRDEKYEWVEITGKAAFAPRDGAGALVFKDKMWLIGGWHPYDKKNFPRDCVNDVWSSSDGKEWKLERANTFTGGAFLGAKDWEGRHTAGYVVHNDMMWIVGGDPIQGHYQNDVWNSENGRDWNLVTMNVPWRQRCLHHTLVFKNKIWIMGGQTIPQFAPEKECFYDDIWCSEDGLNWEEVKVAAPHWSPRGMIGGNVIFKDRMWILGGGIYETDTTPAKEEYNDVWSSPDGIHWECHLKNAPWEPRSYHDVAVFDNKMWVLEGCHPENSNDVWYSEDGVNWTELSDTPWKPRHAATVFVYDNALWMVAGNNMESDVWKLQKK